MQNGLKAAIEASSVVEADVDFFLVSLSFSLVPLFPKPQNMFLSTNDIAVRKGLITF